MVGNAHPTNYERQNEYNGLILVLSQHLQNSHLYARAFENRRKGFRVVLFREKVGVFGGEHALLYDRLRRVLGREMNRYEKARLYYLYRFYDFNRFYRPYVVADRYYGRVYAC